MAMTKNKIHKMIEKGVVYIGVYMRRRKNGKGKVGTSENSAKTRQSNIRKKNGKDFHVIAYFVLSNTTKSRLEHVESGIKMELETVFTHVGNDHFIFPMADRAEGYRRFVSRAIVAGMKVCESYGWEYQLKFEEKFFEKN